MRETCGEQLGCDQVEWNILFSLAETSHHGKMVNPIRMTMRTYVLLSASATGLVGSSQSMWILKVSVSVSALASAFAAVAASVV